MFMCLETVEYLSQFLDTDFLYLFVLESNQQFVQNGIIGVLEDVFVFLLNFIETAIINESEISENHEYQVEWTNQQESYEMSNLNPEGHFCLQLIIVDVEIVLPEDLE